MGNHELTTLIDIWWVPHVGQDMLTHFETPDITSRSSPIGPYIILVNIFFVNAPRLINSAITRPVVVVMFFCSFSCGSDVLLFVHLFVITLLTVSLFILQLISKPD